MSTIPVTERRTADEIANQLQTIGKRTLQIVSPDHPLRDKLRPNEPLRRTPGSELTGRSFDCIVTDLQLTDAYLAILKSRLVGDRQIIYVRTY